MLAVTFWLAGRREPCHLCQGFHITISWITGLGLHPKFETCPQQNSVCSALVWYMWRAFYAIHPTAFPNGVHFVLFVAGHLVGLVVYMNGSIFGSHVLKQVNLQNTVCPGFMDKVTEEVKNKEANKVGKAEIKRQRKTGN